MSSGGQGAGEVTAVSRLVLSKGVKSRWWERLVGSADSQLTFAFQGCGRGSAEERRADQCG